MRIITYNDLPLDGGCVLAIGVFDGVHVGHASLLEKAKKEADAANVPLVVFTFEETPKNEYSKHISSSSEKTLLLEKCGADMVYFASFDACRGMTPDIFVNDVLVGLFGVKCVVCGYDFRFGVNRSGDAACLTSLLENHGRTAVVIPPVYVSDEVVSSTLIRRYISEGDMEKASLLLGYGYSFTLPVEEGNHIGRTMGFPTINQRFPAYRLAPSFGVYACECTFDGITLQGVADIGVKPTVTDKNEIICESHLFGSVGELYGKTVKTVLFKKLRSEKKFVSLSILKEAIAADTDAAKRYFANKK